MKTTIVFLSCLLIAVMSYSQAEEQINITNDTTYVDTLNRNTLGINVFPIFGMLGGGVNTNTKIYVQYKHYFDKMNLRTSFNFTNYYKPNRSIDFIDQYRDTVVTDTATYIRDTMIFRNFSNNIFSYDFRLGLEAAFVQENIRLHIGGAAIVGYKCFEENYYHYKKGIDSLPFERINFIRKPEEIGNIKTSYLKLGVDLSIGVDITISPNIILTLQCTPELAYYKSFKQSLNDPDNYYTEPITERLVFTPDFIDFIISIRF